MKRNIMLLYHSSHKLHSMAWILDMLVLCLASIHSTLGFNMDPPLPYGYRNTYEQSFTQQQMTVRDKTTLPAPSTCQPIYIGGFLRHGARNPTAANSDDFPELIGRIGEYKLIYYYMCLLGGGICFWVAIFNFFRAPPSCTPKNPAPFLVKKYDSSLIRKSLQNSWKEKTNLLQCLFAFTNDILGVSVILL